MQRLLGSILHSGNSERPHRLSIRFRDVNPSERLRLIASALKCMYCLCLLFRCVPNFLIHTRGFLAIVFRHSSNGKNLTSCTSESAGVARLAPCPIGRSSLPARYALGVGECCGGWPASQWRTIPSLRLRPHQWLSPSSFALPHVPICLVLSREALQGSGLAFASGDVVNATDATGICPITRQPSLSP